MTIKKTGIAALGLSFPAYSMSLIELAKIRNEDPNKYTQGLGCHQMALCLGETGVVDLAVHAAKRALSRWPGDPKNIGAIAIGTESAVDMSRPLSAWVAEKLDLRGAVRSYEVKHACYGGTLALRQATEWILSGAAGKKAALVIAADVAMYQENDPGEPTQGAGAVAMIVDGPAIAEIELISYPYSEPVFDFWRPVGEQYPFVDGQFSLECYKRAAESCFHDLIADRDPDEVLNEFHAICLHVPFPKMVQKAVHHIGERFGWPKEKINALFEQKVKPYMAWNQQCGNAYTASLWIAVANALSQLKQGEKIAAFSYGSGCGAELLVLTVGDKTTNAEWVKDVQADLYGNNKRLTGEDYSRYRSAA